MKRLLPITIFTLFGLFLQAQSEQYPVQLKKTNISLNIFSPGLAVEARLTESQSLFCDIALNVGYSDSEDFILVPLAQAQFRNYYSRKRQKKELRANSGNYVALASGYYFKDLGDNLYPTEIINSYFLGGVWGFQRNYMSRIHLDLNLGLGYSNGKYKNASPILILNFQLGFMLGS